ncbi:uncharacterized protein LOC103363320 isoform X2 [Stegastes partitus]|uniref:Uncharacterized protein LOC103363320 isoform X2 n=1 Tax=Stegastes partitus TaxID=144197 RepID=A0A9Y4K544_9TELE|nr:PREDICTED: uncharacterized protein LOC103363320 isoform X2 [Stegastes partitus]
MLPLCGLLLLLCLHCGGLCSAFHIAKTLTLQVDYGQSATLHCNGSAFLEEEGTVHWEAVGQDVAILREGESTVGEHYEGSLFTYGSPDSDTVLMSVTDEEFHLYMTPTMSDSGEYQCWYRTRKSDDPKLGIPESITLTVLERILTDFDPDEATTAAEDWVTASHWPVASWAEEVTETTESNHDFLPVLLEDSTQPMPATESQLMEAFEEKVTFFPDKDIPSESHQLEDLPWIRIGLISGVLLVTAVVLCVLGALRKI